MHRVKHIAQVAHLLLMEPHVKISNQLVNNTQVQPQVAQKLLLQNAIYKALSALQFQMLLQIALK